MILTVPRHRQTSRQLGLTMIFIASLAAGVVLAAPLRTGDGLAGEASGTRLQQVALDGQTLTGCSVETLVIDPRTGQPAGSQFTIAGSWRSVGGRLVLQGEVRAAGTEDLVADLVVRVNGAELALGTMAEDPLLQPAKLLSKLPLVSLRNGGQDRLALAVPPDKLATFEFRKAEGAVELRYRFGFTREAREELRMRAPFTCTLYRTDPRWHFRAALERYYAFFPEVFRPFEKRQGGWFFAAETADLPNPQHFYFHEGGPAGWEQDEARGMGTFPYRESSSYTVSLPGNVPPKNYDEAMARFRDLARQITPTEWKPQQTLAVDSEVKHSGEHAILADPGDTRAWVGASQMITLTPPVSKPIAVSGFSRAEGIDGQPGQDYSIYVDVLYADGSYLFGQTAIFQTGTHDWQEAKKIITPTAPVAELRVYCLLRGHAGKAWFDDLRIGPADAPQVNWLKNPGFETEARRRDLQYISDNVAHNSKGEWVFSITDNLSADVGPPTPLNLLRFTLNPDPDLPSTEQRPAVGAVEIKTFDDIFRDQPAIDGAYIDSVSAWIYGVLNGRRDQWRANDHPFTYDPGNHKVVAAGRWAMVKYLHRLQERYHPLGKSVFTNIHVNLEAFPLYLVSDVPGIESSLFQDEDSMFFYRASASQKPLLLLNFMNLHGLDQRETAVKYHVNAAQWGEFPSTGRFVQRAYQEYGDVTHAYLPAIKELSAAGWQPVPLADGARVERFGSGEVVYFTVRAPQDAVQQVLTIDPAALPKPARDLVAYDAQTLARLSLQRRDGKWEIPFAHGNSDLTIVRVSSREQVLPWLLGRARQHALQAGRVRGRDSLTPEILALQQALVGKLDAPTALAKLPDWHAKLQAASASVVGKPEDLFALSSRRELEQARDALAAVATVVAAANPWLGGERIAYPGQALTVAAELPRTGGAGLRLLSMAADPAGGVPVETRATEGGLTVTARSQGHVLVRAQFELTPAPGQPAWRVERTAALHILPAATMTVKQDSLTAQERVYRVEVRRQAGLGNLEVLASTSPETVIDAPRMTLAPGEQAATVRVRRNEDGVTRTLLLRTLSGGNELARATVSYRDEPPLPAHNLALASGGAKVSADSSYPGGYSPAALTNGRIDTQGLHWTETAWASSDNSQPHWIQIDLPRPATVREVWVYWAQDGGRTYTSRKYQIVGITAGGQRDLLSVNETSTRSFSRHVIQPTELSAIRLNQSAAGGPEGRPGIMWIREVALVQ
ncbi:MAG: discoidin domain-containing protein [Armatimonadia bacterium]